MQETMDVSADLKKTLEEKTGLKLNFTPWAHQVEGVLRSLDKDHFGFFFQIGTGKSATTITAIRAKMAKDKKLYRVLVVTPLITLKNWMREWRNFSEIDHSKIIPLTGTGKKRAELVRKGATVFIASYESLLQKDVFNALVDWGPEILVVDELQRCKNHKAQRSKKVRELSDMTTYRFGLTGTPILQSPMDLFSEMLVIDQGETFGKSCFAFKSQYFFDKNAGMPASKYFPDWKLRKGAEEEIKKKLSACTMQALKSEVLDLPPYVVKTVPLEMDGEQSRMYQEMEKDFISYCADKACVATMALTKGLRLLQIASGFCALEDIHGNKHEVRFADHTKRKALRELLEDIAPFHKVIVWAVFKQNYADIREVCQSLGFKHVELTGEISTEEKFKNMDAFNNDPSVRVCVGHPQSGGVGVNLVAASVNIYYSRSFSLEDYLQSQGRAYRGGSEIHESITEINLVVEKTIEETVVNSLIGKINISDRILRDIAKEAACRS